MRKRFPGLILIYLISWVSIPILFAQDPIVQWDNTIGGTADDRCMSLCTTTDGGYLIGAESRSGISGDKTETQIGGWDFWILKLDASGNIIWQNTIGTTADDRLVKVLQTSDGGYLLGGYTIGGISGDKTEASLGLEDYWIIKLNSTGSIVWQNTIGGDAADVITNLELLPSGSIIVSGYSSSGISGDKTMANYGGKDYWVMKLNTTGSIIWQFGYGGSADDYLVKTLRRSGNFFLAGYSASNISGVKTENSNGWIDLWIMEITESGVINWQNTIGGDGTDNLIDCMLTGTSGYVLLCNSTSDISGNKSQLSFNNTYYSDILSNYVIHDSYDYWVVHVNSTGELIREKTVGGISYEYPKRLLFNNDNRYLIAGYYGDSDYGYNHQITAVDSNGYKIWSDVYSGYTWGDTYNYLNDAAVVPGNGFIIGGSSEEGAGLDKSENAILAGYDDVWIVKLGPDTCSTFPIYSDVDQDDLGGNYLFGACEYTGSEFVTNMDDCDDLNSNISALLPEYCDQIDNNCNGTIDEGLVSCPVGPSIILDASYGGAKRDYITCSIPTDDGGFLLGGGSYSNTDDIVTNNGEMDYCLIKLNESAGVEWIKTYGGASSEKITSINKTTDGGYILGGYSGSGISGDKSEPLIGINDFWIIKIDATGNILWQNTIGGDDVDELSWISQTDDGGYIVCGMSESGVSGDKSQFSRGSGDYWVLKLDALGNIVWQNTIGGNTWDTPSNAVPTTDGGFIIGGHSRSIVSGDKTTPNIGYNDYWIVKLNETGHLTWQKSFGGTNFDEFAKIIASSDGNFLAAGSSASYSSDTKSEDSYGWDYWLIKLDPSGNVIWENTISAEGLDLIADIVETSDSGFLLAGYTSSDEGYDKTEHTQNGYYNPHDYAEFYYDEDFWLVKTNSSGGVIWQNTLGGGGDDHGETVAIASDGSILISGTSSSEADGDKSSPMYGAIWEEMDDFNFYEEDVYFTDLDIWNILFEPETCVPLPEVCNAFDDNCNGLIDDGVVESISIAAAGPISFCQGGSVVLNATYTGATLQWYKYGVVIAGATSASFTVTAKGNYSCTTTSACGTASTPTLFVDVLKNPNASITAGGPTTFCAGGSVTLTEAPVTGCSYQWYKGAAPIAGATSTSYTATLAGNYKCRVTKTATGCFKNSNTIVVSVPCKEGEDALLNTTLNIQPNPNNGTFTISAHSLSSLETTKLIIYNTTGQQIFTRELDPQQDIFEINMPEIPTGMYIVKLISGTNIYEQKLIIE